MAVAGDDSTGNRIMYACTDNSFLNGTEECGAARIDHSNAPSFAMPSQPEWEPVIQQVVRQCKNASNRFSFQPEELRLPKRSCQCNYCM